MAGDEYVACRPQTGLWDAPPMCKWLCACCPEIEFLTNFNRSTRGELFAVYHRRIRWIGNYSDFICHSTVVDYLEANVMIRFMQINEKVKSIFKQVLF